MSDNKKKRDIISEQEFNDQTVQDIDLPPQEDSPGDGDENVAKEYMLGVNYMPDEKNEYENPGDAPFEKVYADEKSTSPSEIPSLADPEVDDEDRIPATARVVSSDFPAPREDSDTVSDTH